VTKFLSGVMVVYWRALPVVLMLALWLFFAGTKEIRRRGQRRLWREALLLSLVFGFLFAIACFACYGLVDPANGLARKGAVPVSAAELARFELLGYASIVGATCAAVALEWELRRGT
jgi:hypothetical protein